MEITRLSAILTRCEAVLYSARPEVLEAGQSSIIRKPIFQKFKENMRIFDTIISGVFFFRNGTE